MAASRDFHFQIRSTRGEGERYGIYDSIPTDVYQAAQAAGVRAGRTASYGTAAARDKAAAKTVAALLALDVDTSTLVLVRTSDAAMVGANTTYERLDGTALTIKGQVA